MRRDHDVVEGQQRVIFRRLLNEYVEAAAQHRQQVPLLADLKKVLRNSKSPRFVEVKSVSSAISHRVDKFGKPVPRTVHCWVFERPANRRR